MTPLSNELYWIVEYLCNVNKQNCLRVTIAVKNKQIEYRRASSTNGRSLAAGLYFVQVTKAIIGFKLVYRKTFLCVLFSTQWEQPCYIHRLSTGGWGVKKEYSVASVVLYLHILKFSFKQIWCR